LDIREALYNQCFESVRLWRDKFPKLYNPSKRGRRLVAWMRPLLRLMVIGVIDVDSREVLAVYVSRGRSMLNTLIFLKRVLKACENRPVIVVDRGPWYIVETNGSTKYPWALKRLGLEYFHETFDSTTT
jgi:putative transposase